MTGFPSKMTGFCHFQNTSTRESYRGVSGNDPKPTIPNIRGWRSRPSLDQRKRDVAAVREALRSMLPLESGGDDAA